MYLSCKIILMRICSKCKLRKHESEFFARKDGACGLRSQCKTCHKAYYQSSSGKQMSRKYNTSLKRKLKHRIHGRKYSSSERGLETRKRYMSSINGRAAARGGYLRRRDRALGLDAKLNLNEIKNLYLKFNNKCFNCGSINHLEIDHHRPLASGHGLSIDNAVILCRSCNASKRDKSPEEFYSQDRLLQITQILEHDPV